MRPMSEVEKMVWASEFVTQKDKYVSYFLSARESSLRRYKGPTVEELQCIRDESAEIACLHAYQAITDLRTLADKTRNRLDAEYVMLRGALVD